MTAEPVEQSGLPPRQREVLQLLLEGLSVKEVAARLELSPNTVHSHIKTIYLRFSVSSRAELLARWIRRGTYLNAETLQSSPPQAEAQRQRLIPDGD